METPRLNLEEKTFMANGNKYYYSQNMCIDRFVEFERLQAHVGFGKDFKNLYDEMKRAYDFLNTNKLADGAVVLHNLINGIAQNLEKRDHPILQLCALFINREDENVKEFDASLNDQKIEDWKKEGYAIADFFQLAFNFVEGFIPAYNEIIQDISNEAEKAVASSIGNKE